jgi:hypothetical protein
MLPTDEERAKIQEAQLASPELPLGSAEQFLLSLASITELAARLKLWLFKSDYENMEKVLLSEDFLIPMSFNRSLSIQIGTGRALNGFETRD